jgi:methyl-accepting chemotaxis protein
MTTWGQLCRSLRLPTKTKSWPIARQVGNLKLAPRLAVGFGLVLLLLIGITAASLVSMNQMAQGMRNIVETNNQRVALASGMTLAVNEASIAVRNLVIIAWVDELPSEMLLLKKAMKRYDENKQALIPLLEHEREDSDVRRQMSAINDVEKDARKVMIDAGDLALNGKKEDATTMVALDLRMAQNAWVEEIAKLVALETSQSAQAYEAARSSFKRSQALLSTAAALALAIGVTAAWLIARSVTRPIARAVASAQKVASGDLSEVIHCDRVDETGQLLQALAQMQVFFRTLVGEVGSATQSISLASSEIAVGNQDLSMRTERAASNLQMTASRLEHLTATVTQSADAARHADELARSASQAAARGGKDVSHIVSTMDDIQASSRKIAEIIGVIDDIAFQTNILALNAAVEAARAGDQGRGFAVVSTEVRNLATRSAVAAKEIKSLIKSSVDKVDAGSRLVRQAGTSMTNIVTSVESVGSKIAEISAVVQDQSAGLREVNESVGKLEEVTQQNASLVEQAAAASESLKEQAHRLADVMRAFKLQPAEAPHATTS